MDIKKTFESGAALLAEYESHLVKARSYVSGTYALKEGDPCRLVLVHPDSGETLALGATAVYLAPQESPGVGLEIEPLSADSEQALRTFVSPPRPSSEVPSARVPHLAEQVRHLNARERDKMARSGTLTERTALERAYGSVVWEALLANPQLTTGEVVRLAKNGTITIPLLNVITANLAWLMKPEIRRALLTNPRLTAAHIEKVLRYVPAQEMKLMSKQTAYPAQVRAIAERKLS